METGKRHKLGAHPHTHAHWSVSQRLNIENWNPSIFQGSLPSLRPQVAPTLVCLPCRDGRWWAGPKLDMRCGQNYRGPLGAEVATERAREAAAHPQAPAHSLPLKTATPSGIKGGSAQPQGSQPVCVCRGHTWSKHHSGGVPGARIISGNCLLLIGLLVSSGCNIVGE